MQDINEGECEKEVLGADKPVIVDFNAEWCGPCRMMKPILKAFAKQHEDVKVVGVNIDDNEDLAMEYGVGTIPCLVVFKDGKETTREVGVQPEKKLVKMLEA